MAEYNYQEVRNADGSLKCFQFSSSREGIRYFTDHFGADIAKALAGTGIFLAVSIGQKSMESNYGTHRFARLYNNFGGIMNPSGHTPFASGSIKISGNRTLATFDTPMDCFKCYAATLLSTKKRYISSGLLTAKTPQQQLLAIANGGYCTDPPPAQYYKGILPAVELAVDMFSTGKIKVG